MPTARCSTRPSASRRFRTSAATSTSPSRASWSRSPVTKADALTLRLLASDLDGTLVGPSGVLSPRTRAMLDACDAAEIPIVFVTGRPPRWLDKIADGRSGVAICANGALVLDLPTRAVLEATTFEPAVVLEVAARLRQVLPEATFGLETPAGFAMEPAYVPSYYDGVPVTAPLAELTEREPIVKVLV